MAERIRLAWPDVGPEEAHALAEVLDAAYEQALALPFHTRLSDEAIDRVVAGLRPFA